MVLCDKVIIDDKQAAYEAVQSLIDRERKSPLSPLLIMCVGKLRTDGYIKALLDNIPFNENLIIKIEDVDTCEIIMEITGRQAIDAVLP
jgi:LacI family transcriptional regulator